MLTGVKLFADGHMEANYCGVTMSSLFRDSKFPVWPDFLNLVL